MKRVIRDREETETYIWQVIPDPDSYTLEPETSSTSDLKISDQE